MKRDGEDLDLDTIRARLEQRLDEVGLRIEEITRAPERGSGIGFGKRVGDGTTEAIDRLNQVGVAERLDTTGGQIARALEKLGDGTYGICDGCGAMIPAGRLNARPESVVCVDCARS